MWLRLVSCFLLLVGWATHAQVPQQCLQSPLRQQLCPHTIYKKAVIPVPALTVEKGQMICICLSDITDIQDADRQRDAVSSIANSYQLGPAEIYQLLELPQPKKH